MSGTLRRDLVFMLANKLAEAYGAPSALPDGGQRRVGTRGGPSRDREYDANRWRRFLYLAAYRPRYFSRGLDRQLPHGSGVSGRVKTCPASRRLLYLVGQAQHLREHGKHPRSDVYRYPLWHEYRVPRPGGEPRIIHIPHPALRLAQLEVINMLSSAADRFWPLSFGMRAGAGGVASHARQHANARFAAQFDLADCFPSITVPHLIRALCRIGHLSLGRLRLSVDIESAVLLALLCTRRRCLVQGAPSSPILADLVLSHADRLIAERVARDLPGARYSRYFDDLCVSITSKDARDRRIDFSRFKALVSETIRDSVATMGFAVNPRKTVFTDTRPARSTADRRPLPATPLMTITGIAIRDGQSVLPRSARRRLRAMEHGLRTSGLSYLWRDGSAVGEAVQPSRSSATPQDDWKRALDIVRAHRSFLVRHVRDGVPMRGKAPSDSSAGWRNRIDRVGRGELEPGTEGSLLLPPAPGSAKDRTRDLRKSAAPPHWLSVRLAVWDKSSNSIVFDDFTGRTAWHYLREVAEQLPTGRVTIQNAEADGTVTLAFDDSEGHQCTLGLRDPLGVIPKVLAVKSTEWWGLATGLRKMQAFVAHCLFVASALGDREARPEQIRSLLLQLGRSWQEAPLPSPPEPGLGPVAGSLGDRPAAGAIEIRGETLEERDRRKAEEQHRKAAEKSWEAILQCRALETKEFQRHRVGWTMDLLKHSDHGLWWRAIETLLGRGTASREASVSAPTEPAPETLLRSCRLMLDRKNKTRVAHYTLRSDASRGKAALATTRLESHRQQEALYEQATSLGEAGAPDQGQGSDWHDLSHLVKRLRNAVARLVAEKALDRPGDDGFNRLEKMLGDSEDPAASRLPGVAMLLQKLTLENIPCDKPPPHRTPEDHKNDCRNRFLKGIADKDQRRCFELMRSLRNLEAHSPHVAGLLRRTGDNPEVEIKSLRQRCLELIGAFEEWEGPPGDDDHVLKDMMSPLEGRETALELTRRVVRGMESWRTSDTASNARSSAPPPSPDG